MSTVQKIKVAFFAEILIRDFDGASRTMYQLIDRIPNDRYEFLFFCGTPPDHKMEHKVIETPAITIPFNSTYKAAFPFFKKGKLTKDLDGFSPDVIHIATPSPLGNFALAYAKRKDIPVLSIYHTHFISYMEYYFKGISILTTSAEKLVASGYRKFYNRCDLVYVPTNQMIKELVSHGVDVKPLKLWQRGLNQELFDTQKRDLAYIQSITKNDLPNIIYASRLVWEKNVTTLIKIYQRAQERGLNYNFIIVGNGVAEESARAKMKDAHFFGHVDHEELATLYASSDYFVFPSISETYGNVVVEAMASGCSCIIAKGGGSQSLVQDGVTGYLCDPNNPDDYLDKIEYLRKHPEVKKDFKTNGLNYTKQLDWDALADEYFADVELLAK